MRDIDFSKVKKSPIPASIGEEHDGVLLWFRGDGIKIMVTCDRIDIMDADDSVIATRPGQYGDDMSTKDVKDLAKAMLNRANQKLVSAGHIKDGVVTQTYPEPDERTSEWGTTRENVDMSVPKVRIDPSKARPAFMNPAHRAEQVVLSPLAAMFGGRGRALA